MMRKKMEVNMFLRRTRLMSLPTIVMLITLSRAQTQASLMMKRARARIGTSWNARLPRPINGEQRKKRQARAWKGQTRRGRPSDCEI
ncbi:hypothetical protein BC829DRAFT_379944 [Chytridium lagenaria]|nr:hypothetical protein BC829DRAFT_379944 [Chytridium lagenaria]